MAPQPVQQLLGKAKGRPYKKQAKRLLLTLFPQTTCAAIHVVMHNAEYSFEEAYRMLHVLQQQYAAGTSQFHLEGLHTVQNVFLDEHRQTQQPLQLTDASLIQEVRSMQNHDGLNEKALASKGVQILQQQQHQPTATSNNSNNNNNSNETVVIDIDAEEEQKNKNNIVTIDAAAENESTTTQNNKSTAVIDIDAEPPTKRKRRRQTSSSARRPKVDLSNAPVVDLTDHHDILTVGETECGVCFGDFEAEDMVPCSGNESHLACQECLSRYVSEQVDGNNSVAFKCIVSMDCTHGYKNHLLDLVLSPKLKERVNDRIFRNDLAEAGLDNTWTCPKCAFIGFVEGDHPTVECISCHVTFCTACNEPEHKDKTCEDVKQDKILAADPLHRAHEMMSQAVKRVCPGCKQTFQKLDGCNKITCTCGVKSCYMCGQQVQNYDHFCNHNKTCKCGKCPLYVTAPQLEKIDNKKREEVGTKVLQEAGMNEKEIKKALASLKVKKKAPKTPRAKKRA